MNSENQVDKKLNEQVETLGRVVDSLSTLLEETGQHIQKEGSDLDKARTNYDLTVKKLLNDMKLKRKKDGLTLDGLSEKLSVSSAYISQLERGLKNNVSYSLGKKIEDYLKE